MRDHRSRLSPMGRIIHDAHAGLLRELIAFSAVILFTVGVGMALYGVRP